MQIAEIQKLVKNYLEIFPEEKQKLARLIARLDSDEEAFNSRKSFSGHGTGGAIVLSPDRTKILLIHHKGLGKWMQPGGHWDPEDEFPWQVAQREAEEETGVTIAERLAIPGCGPSVPIDIDSHDIPDRPSRNEPAHVHHDFRYIFVVTSEELVKQDEEINEAVWVPVTSDDERLAEVMPSIVKMRRLKLI